MPVFEIQSPDGTTFEYENDQAPTSDVLDQIFGRAKPQAAPVATPAPPAPPSFENQLSMPETEGLIRGIPEPAADLLTPSQQIRQMATESTAAQQPIGAPVPSTEELVDKERFGLRLGPNAPSVEEAPPSFAELQALGSAGSFLGPEAQRAAVSGLRTVYNNLKGLPEFALSEEGLLTGLASATGPVGRLAVEGYFTYDMAKSLLEQAKQSGQEWDQMSTPQKVSAITQMALTAILTAVIGKAGLKTGAKAIRAPGGLADVVAPIPTPQPRAIYGDVLPPPAERGIPTSVGTTEAPPLPEPNVEIAKELGGVAQEPVGNFDRYEFPPDAPGKPRAQVAVPKGSPVEVVREKLQAARDRFKEEPAAPAEATPTPATPTPVEPAPIELKTISGVASEGPKPSVPAPETAIKKTTPFEVDEQVIMRSPHTGDDILVSYRGKPSEGNAVVWTGKSQMQIPESWLRHQGEKYERQIPTVAKIPGVVEVAQALPTTSEGGGGVQPTARLSKSELIQELVGPEPSYLQGRLDWKKRRVSLAKFTKDELSQRVNQQRKMQEENRKRSAILPSVSQEFQEVADAAGPSWRPALREYAQRTDGVTMNPPTTTKAEMVAIYANEIAGVRVRKGTLKTKSIDKTEPTLSIKTAPAPVAQEPTGESIAKNLALKYEGTTESPSTGKIDKYVDENGVTVRVPAGTDEAGVAKKLAERRAEYKPPSIQPAPATPAAPPATELKSLRKVDLKDDPRLDMPGITRRVKANSLIVQIRSLESLPIRDIVLKSSGDPITDSKNVEGTIRNYVNEHGGDASIRESLAVTTGPNGRAILKFGISPNGMTWAPAQAWIDLVERAKIERGEPPKPPAPPPAEAPSAPAVSSPAAAAKVETEVAKVATTEGQRSAKDIKSELVSELEKRIAESQTAESDVFEKFAVRVPKTSGPRVLVDAADAVTGDIPLNEWLNTKPKSSNDLNRFSGAGVKFIAEALTRAGVKKSVVDIPGDGEFTIWDTKEALQGVLDRARKISTSPGAPTTIKKSGITKADREWVAQQIAKGGEPAPTTATAEPGFKGIAASAREKLDKPPALGDEGGFFTLHQAIYDTGAKLYQKGMSFASWAASMVRELGERVRVHLQDIWDRLTINQPAMDPKAQSSRTELLSVIGMTPDEWVDYKRQQKTYGPDKVKELGAQVRLSDLGRMIEQRDALNAEYSRLLEEATTDEGKVDVIQNRQNLLVKAQTLNELIQSATNIGGEIKDANQVRAFSGIPVPDIGYIWDQITKAAGEFPSDVRKAWRSFSMQALPRITDSSRTAGEAGVRFASAPMVARSMGLDFAQRVTEGLKLPKDFDLKFGTGITEDNLRDLKRIWHERALEAADRANIIQQLRDQIDDLSDAAKHGDQGAISETKQMTADIARLSKLTDLDAEDFQTKSDSVTTMIGAEASPFKNEQQYRDFMQSPQAQEAIRRHIAMWETEKDPLYRQANDLDPDMELQTRGLEYGARVNLKNLLRDQGTRTTVGPATRSPLIRATATLQKADPFGRRAKGSGSYEGSYKEIMANGFGREYPVAKRHEFIRELLASGDAVLRNREYDPDLEIGGESTKAYPLKLRPWTGKFLHLKRSLAEEYEDAIGLSAATRASLYSKVAELATRSSVQGLAEGSTHISNLLSQVFTGLGPTGDPLLNALIKSAGRVDVLYSIPKILITAFSDRKHDMMRLAEIGAAKEPYRGGVGWLITKIDQGMRLYSADVYKKLAANGYVPDTETGLREYVNQVGNYNKRLQPRLIQHLRSTGFQPFATAMQTFNVQGLRTLTAAPGVEATSAVAHSKLMADKAANIMGFGVLVTALNLLVSGTAFGPKGTKLGAVGWIGDDKRLHQLDIGSLTGISRGARITGIQAFTEAKRLGLPTQSAVLTGAQGAANTAISTATGPMNRFIFMAATGKRPSIPAVQEAPVVPPQKDFSLIKNQVSANILEAAKQANPIVDFVVRAKQGKYEEAFSRQFSRYTPKTGMAVETIENLPKVVQASELNNYLDNLARESRKIPRGHLRMEFINDRIARDQMDETLRRRALEGLRRRGVFTR